MALTEGTSRDALGGIVIRSRMRFVANERAGWEKQFFPGIEVGLPGWERAHSQGKITGVESPNAIRYAPSEVNQEFQKSGIERFIRELFDQKAPETEIWLTTVTYTHPRTLRLKEIQYRVDVAVNNTEKTLFEASIEVADQRVAPRVGIQARERLPRAEWLPLIKNELKRNQILYELNDKLLRLKNLCELYQGEHRMQKDLVDKSIAGYLTNRVFNTLPPPLEIWDRAFARLAAARDALNRKDIKRATKEVLMARAHYLFALKKYSIWKNGIDGAGKNMQIAIGVVAVVAILVAVGAYAVSEKAVGAAAATASEASLAATEQAVVRVRVATYELEQTLQAIEALSAAQEAAALAEYEAAIEAFELTL